jgi:hypothetical protein
MIHKSGYHLIDRSFGSGNGCQYEADKVMCHYYEQFNKWSIPLDSKAVQFSLTPSNKLKRRI